MRKDSEEQGTCQPRGQNKRKHHFQPLSELYPREAKLAISTGLVGDTVLISPLPN